MILCFPIASMLFRCDSSCDDTCSCNNGFTGSGQDCDCSTCGPGSYRTGCNTGSGSPGYCASCPSGYASRLAAHVSTLCSCHLLCARELTMASLLWFAFVPTCVLPPQFAHVQSQPLQDHHKHFWLLCVPGRLWGWKIPLRLRWQLVRDMQELRQRLWKWQVQVRLLRPQCWLLCQLRNQLWKWQVQVRLLRPQCWLLCQLRLVWARHIPLQLQRSQRRVMPCVRNKVSAKLRCCYMGWFAWRTQQQH